MKKLLFYSLILLFFGWFSLFSESRRFIWDKKDKEKFELIEEVPEYDGFINWTSGKVQCSMDMPADKAIPNLGKYLNNNFTYMKDELKQKLIKVMGYVRVSDLFLIKDYYSMKNQLRYEIISFADRAFYLPPVQKKDRFLGMVELELYGKDGVANLFYDSLEEVEVTNYILKESKELEYFDSLVVDTLIYKEFNPSLFMRVYDEDGVQLYGPETIDREILKKHGVCEYTTTLTHAFNSSRSGNRVFYTFPYAIKGIMKTDLVLHNKDASRLLASPRTQKFLRHGKVIVVKSP